MFYCFCLLVSLLYSCKNKNICFRICQPYIQYTNIFSKSKYIEWFCVDISNIITFDKIINRNYYSLYLSLTCRMLATYYVVPVECVSRQGTKCFIFFCWFMIVITFILSVLSLIISTYVAFISFDKTRRDEVLYDIQCIKYLLKYLTWYRLYRINIQNIHYTHIHITSIPSGIKWYKYYCNDLNKRKPNTLTILLLFLIISLAVFGIIV